MVEADELRERIRQALGSVSHLEVRDLTGTKDHWEAVIVSKAFSGKSRIEQHQMVYAALGELMAGPVHALALKTYSPESWSKQEG
ncbi:MAG TPA: BolA family transcriptional regulator [Polyangiales bacterium]|nr:BolA family transcriptional regulator [Polyangiales bacterium]